MTPQRCIQDLWDWKPFVYLILLLRHTEKVDILPLIWYVLWRAECYICFKNTVWYAGSLTIEKIRIKGLSWRDVFVEIPITIHNSALAVALMAEIEPPTIATQQDYDRWGTPVRLLQSAQDYHLWYISDAFFDTFYEYGLSMLVGWIWASLQFWRRTWSFWMIAWMILWWNKISWACTISNIGVSSSRLPNTSCRGGKKTSKDERQVSAWVLAVWNWFWYLEEEVQQILCNKFNQFDWTNAGEEPLTEDPPEGMFKAVAEPNQLDNMLLSNQMSSYCDHINTAAKQTVEKLNLMEGLQQAAWVAYQPVLL